jgi:hypothetical protein
MGLIERMFLIELSSRPSEIFLHISKENYRQFPRFKLALQHGNAYKASIDGKDAVMSLLLNDPEEA